MHLIAPLMAGVKGAESGSVTVYQRGTTTPATCYTDFEGTSSFTAAGLSLDANGGRAIYVNELVRVIVLSSGGATIRDFVTGSAATAVEVRSASFNGAAYSGGAIAPGNPTTVKAVLDKWFTSAGAVDFNVLLNGSSASLQTALAAVAGLGLYVVTNPTYGAVGDGVTDDKAAIQAAINAANAAGGGVVFFPGGTYRVASSLTTYATVTLRGVEKARSVIKVDHNASVQFTGAVPSGFEDLGFTLNVARTFALIDITSASSTRFERCAFNAAVATGEFVSGTFAVGTIPSMLLLSCEVNVSGTFSGTLFEPYGYLIAVGCRFNVSGSYTGSVIGPSSSVAISGCFFNMGDITGGTSIVVEAITGTVTGCFFFAQSTAVTLIGAAANAAIHESGNALLHIHANGVIYATKTYDNRRLVGRDITRRTYSHAAAVTSTTLDALAYSNLRIQNTGAPGANFTINFSVAPIGATATLAVHNDTGSSITYAWGTNHAMSGTTFAVAANSVRCFYLQNVDFDGSSCKWHTVADAAGSQENE